MSSSAQYDEMDTFNLSQFYKADQKFHSADETPQPNWLVHITNLGVENLRDFLIRSLVVYRVGKHGVDGEPAQELANVVIKKLVPKYPAETCRDVLKLGYDQVKGEKIFRKYVSVDVNVQLSLASDAGILVKLQKQVATLQTDTKSLATKFEKFAKKNKGGKKKLGGSMKEKFLGVGGAAGSKQIEAKKSSAVVSLGKADGEGGEWIDEDEDVDMEGAA